MVDSALPKRRRLRRRLSYTISAAGTIEGARREAEYYEALGRFVQMFAEVEKVLAQTLWFYAKSRPEVAKIIFAGTQSEMAATYIKALAKATNASDAAKADLENVLHQFGIIRSARNDILHYGATLIAEGRGVVSNAWKAKAQPNEFLISAEALVHMESDLRKIIAHFGYRHLGRPWPVAAWNVQWLETTLRAPWQYKHRAPPRSQTNTAVSPRVRRRGLRRPPPPPASQA